MLRSSIALPLFLSALVLPATAAEPTTSYCSTSTWKTPRCEAERAREEAKARNAQAAAASNCQPYNWLTASCGPERAGDVAAYRGTQIDTASTCQPYNWLTASCEPERAGKLAAARVRELSLATSHCKTPGSTSPRCLAERARQFAQERNAEIDRSIAAVKAARAGRLAQALTHCKTPNSTTPRCLAEREHQFEQARNAEIDASIARVKAERERQFAAERNAEINRSIAAVKAERARVLAQVLTHCKTPDSTTPRCLAEREHQFAQARNLEIEASIARVAAVRAFEKERNAEIEASITRVKAERERQFARARNAEINASIALVQQIRAREFAAARNAEIDSVLAAYEAQRILRIAKARMAAFGRSRNEPTTAPERLETGAIGNDPTPAVNSQFSRQKLYAEPCPEASNPVDPLRFPAASAAIEDDMKPALDNLALVAHSCPGVRIKVHGYADAAGPLQSNRDLAALRAEAVRGYLIAAGVSANRIGTFAHGAPRSAEAEGNADGDADSGYVELNVSDLTVDASAARIMWELADLLDPAYIPPLARLSP